MLKKVSKAEVLLALVLFFFAVWFPVIDELSEANLAFHMTVQHFMVIVPGFILGAQLARLRVPGKFIGWVLALVTAGLVGFWHIPRFWDQAFSSEPVHVLEHLSFLVAGVSAMLSLAALGRPVKWLLLVAYLVFASILAASTVGGRQIYQSSSPAQHRELASYMVMTMPVIFFAVALSPAYLPQLINFWTKRRLSLWLSALLVLLLVIGWVL